MFRLAECLMLGCHLDDEIGIVGRQRRRTCESRECEGTIAGAAVNDADGAFRRYHARRVLGSQAPGHFEGFGIAPLVAQGDDEFVEWLRSRSGHDMGMAEADEGGLGIAIASCQRAAQHEGGIVVRQPSEDAARFLYPRGVPQRFGVAKDEIGLFGVRGEGHFEGG
jgi:hypothetical protein